MKVAIANFGNPITASLDYEASWATHTKPPRIARPPLFEQPHDWGFHIYALGSYLMEKGLADEVEFWDFAESRSTSFHSTGILRVMFHNADDVQAYLDRYGYPGLYVNHGSDGQPILDMLENRTFRVHVPALRVGRDCDGNFGAECYLVDSEDFLDERSMVYIPVVNTRAISPAVEEKKWDFIYLAGCYSGKRHDLVLRAARESGLSGHLHPVDESQLAFVACVTHRCICGGCHVQSRRHVGVRCGRTADRRQREHPGRQAPRGVRRHGRARVGGRLRQRHAVCPRAP